MARVLNITNGDAAVELMRVAGVEGEYLPWRDVLHEGPVPDGLALPELSRLRAQYIASLGWAERESVADDFSMRDTRLESLRQFDKVLLWFEHDLYDQLQILQILDWCHLLDLGRTRLAMICTGQYLGHCTAENIMDLYEYEQAVTKEQLALASSAWSAFRQPTPEAWITLRSSDTRSLPFLEGAVLRLLQEYPAVGSGLTRSEQQSLKIIRHDRFHPARLFGEYQKTEQRMFMGDLSYWKVLEGLLNGNPPLIALSGGNSTIEPADRDNIIVLTGEGAAVLEERINWLDTNEIDRWLGGVHLVPGQLWFWDESNGTITDESQ
jgi:hypothetical protein